MAKSILLLVVTIWAWTRNGKPRKKLGGLSPADYYRDYTPTQEEIKNALLWIYTLKQRQEKMRRSRARRADPVRRTIIREALDELRIPDPKQHTEVALSTYSMKAILQGIATFMSKRDMDTIPKEANDARFLGGIIRNLNIRDEQEKMGRYLLELRLRQQDLTLAHLEEQASSLTNAYTSEQLTYCLIDNALDAHNLIAFRFWAYKTVDVILQQHELPTRKLYDSAIRRVAASFSTDTKRREDLIDILASAFAHKFLVGVE